MTSEEVGGWAVCELDDVHCDEEPEKLRLCVKHTFLHVEDVDEEVVKMGRSRSESSLHPSSASSFSVQSGSASDNDKPQKEEIPPASETLHIVFSSSNSSGSFDDGLRSPDGYSDTLLILKKGTAYAPSPEERQKAEMWSKGSENHNMGDCKPCAWNWQLVRGGCNNGADCPFCHLCPPGSVRQRRREQTVKIKDEKRFLQTGEIYDGTQPTLPQLHPPRADGKAHGTKKKKKGSASSKSKGAKSQQGQSSAASEGQDPASSSHGPDTKFSL